MVKLSKTEKRVLEVLKSRKGYVNNTAVAEAVVGQNRSYAPVFDALDRLERRGLVVPKH